MNSFTVLCFCPIVTSNSSPKDAHHQLTITLHKLPWEDDPKPMQLLLSSDYLIIVFFGLLQSIPCSLLKAEKRWTSLFCWKGSPSFYILVSSLGTDSTRESNGTTIIHSQLPTYVSLNCVYQCKQLGMHFAM